MDGWTEDEESLERWDNLVDGAIQPLNQFLDNLHRNKHLDKSPNSILLVLLGQALNTYHGKRLMNENPKDSFQFMVETMSTNPLLAQLMLMGGVQR